MEHFNRALAEKHRGLMRMFLITAGTALSIVFASFLIDLKLYRTQEALARNYARDVVLAQELRNNLTLQASLRRGFLRTADPSLAATLSVEDSEVARNLADLRKWYASEDEPRLLEEIKSKEERLRKVWSAILRRRPPPQPEALAIEGDFRSLETDLLASVSTLVVAKNADLESASHLARRSGQLSVGLSGLLGVGLLLVVGFTSAFVRRSLDAIKEGQRDLERQKRELEQTVSIRTRNLEVVIGHLREFGYSVAHDLRRPARSIASFAEILLDRERALGEESRSQLQRIRDASLRLRMMLDGLLSLSRISQQQPSSQALELGAIARLILDEISSHEPARKVNVVIQQPLRAEGDPKLIEILLQNLLENAWKFTGRTDNARIEVGAETRDGETAYFVRDNGVGFEQAFSDQLFQVFHRLPGAEEFPGMGIGLASAARVVEAHGGRIWAVSSLGNGATFYFTLRRPA